MITPDDLQNFEAGMVARNTIIKNKFWQSTESYQKMFLNCLLINLSKIYDVPICKIVFDLNTARYDNTGGGTYCDNIATLNSVSVMTAIHEFGHHLQKNGYSLNPDCQDIEIECQQWSHTIFFIMSPHIYIKSLNNSLFHHNDVKFLNPIGSATGDALSMSSAISIFYTKFYHFIHEVMCRNSIILSVDNIGDIVYGNKNLIGIIDNYRSDHGLMYF